MENAMIGALFGRFARRIGTAEARKVALESLEFVGLAHEAEEPAARLT